MPLPARLDLAGNLLGVYRGDDYALRLPFTLGGDPMPLTGVWRAQHRRDKRATAHVDFDLSDSDMPGGVLVLRLTAAQTASLMPGEWDLEQTTTGGQKITWLAGTVEVSGDVTR